MKADSYIVYFITGVILLTLVLLGIDGFYSKLGLRVSIGIPIFIIIASGFGIYKNWKEQKHK